jgi:hypothetical protein
MPVITCDEQRRANAAALLATLNMLIMTAGRWRGLYRTDAGSRLS